MIFSRVQKIAKMPMEREEEQIKTLSLAFERDVEEGDASSKVSIGLV